MSASQQTLTAYYVVPDVQAYLQFLQAAFGAEVLEAMKGSDGVVMHAEVRIGTSILMMGQARAETPVSGSMQYVSVDNVDQAYQRLLDAGATSIQEPEDQFYGHRTAAGRDPVGHQWWLAEPREELSKEELAKRAREAR